MLLSDIVRLLGVKCQCQILQIFRVQAIVGFAQGVFFNLYTLFYMLSPKHCHAFVGYLEEEVGLHPLSPPIQSHSSELSV